MNLDKLEEIVPRLNALQEELAVLPDFHDDLQAELLRDMAVELRKIADDMEGMQSNG